MQTATVWGCFKPSWLGSCFQSIRACWNINIPANNFSFAEIITGGKGPTSSLHVSCYVINTHGGLLGRVYLDTQYRKATFVQHAGLAEDTDTWKRVKSSLSFCERFCSGRRGRPRRVVCPGWIGKKDFRGSLFKYRLRYSSTSRPA